MFRLNVSCFRWPVGMELQDLLAEWGAVRQQIQLGLRLARPRFLLVERVKGDKKTLLDSKWFVNILREFISTWQLPLFPRFLLFLSPSTPLNGDTNHIGPRNIKADSRRRKAQKKGRGSDLRLCRFAPPNCLMVIYWGVKKLIVERSSPGL